jgi:hypothetical protein
MMDVEEMELVDQDGIASWHHGDVGLYIPQGA